MDERTKFIPKGVRFAPSPSGSFHIGNLRTAWVSKQIADFFSEPWIVRVEDIDTPRVIAGAWDAQRDDLATLGLIPSLVTIQSQYHDRHFELFERARREGRVYPCDCSRREVLDDLAQMARAPHGTPAEYSGRCRQRFEEAKASGVSVTSPDFLSRYKPTDTLAWRWARDASGHHDPIVARTASNGTGFVPGYHWACAIDDADGGYRVLVRAWDLASANPIQREIRLWVSPEADPVVFHTALVTRDDGGRLEKRTQGVTLAEVLSHGVSVTQLVEKLKKSFDLSQAIAAVESKFTAGTLGEGKKTISLNDLDLNR